jgi:cytoskeletal protein RodZ
VWTLGETLRQARLDKGVSLADAARETRIRRAYLEALEGEDAAALPGPVYTRGFLRSYAEYLGLNPQSIVDLFEPAARRESGSPALRPAVPHVAPPRQIPVRPALYSLGAIFFVALLAFAWNWYQDVQHSLNPADPLRSARVGTPTPSGARLPTAPPIVLAIASPSPTATPEPPPPPTPTPGIDGILVEFHTTDRVYVEAAVDGKQVMAETLQPGIQRSLPLAQSTVVLRASNAAAVDVTVNGTHQDPQTSTQPMEFTWRR